jgi:hypothetical protein
MQYDIEVGGEVPLNQQDAPAFCVDAPEPQLYGFIVDFGVDIEEPKNQFHTNQHVQLKQTDLKL